MTKIDFIENLSEKLHLPKRQIAKVVESVFDIIKETLQREDKLMVSGLGDFIIRNKRARRGRNPHSGSDIVISPRRVLTFKPSSVFKARLNQWKEKHISSVKASQL
jgi:integration host factor subunit alpha